MLDFLEARAVPATETVADGVYRRSLRIVGDGDAGAAGIVEVRHLPARGALSVAMAPALQPHAPQVLARIAHLFDVGSDPAAIAPVLGELAAAEPGLRLPGSVDVFELAVRALLGQQVTVAAARTLATRFVARFGAALPAAGGPAANGPPPVPAHLFPDAAQVAAIDPAELAATLGELGIVRTRGHAIAQVARAIAAGAVPTGDGARALPQPHAVAATIATLRAIRGIGPWTAHYIAMRGLGDGDAFPPGDIAACRALGAASAKEAAAMAERWRPWRAYALMHLWRRVARRPASAAGIAPPATASAPS